MQIREQNRSISKGQNKRSIVNRFPHGCVSPSLKGRDQQVYQPKILPASFIEQFTFVHCRTVECRERSQSFRSRSTQWDIARFADSSSHASTSGVARLAAASSDLAAVRVACEQRIILQPRKSSGPNRHAGFSVAHPVHVTHHPASGCRSRPLARTASAFSGTSCDRISAQPQPTAL